MVRAAVIVHPGKVGDIAATQARLGNLAAVVRITTGHVRRTPT